MKKILFAAGLLGLCLLSIPVAAQSVATTSNEVSLDFSEKGKSYSTSIPRIVFHTPASPVLYQKEGRVELALSIESKHDLESVSMTLVNNETGSTVTTTKVPVTEQTKRLLKIEKSITIPEGVHKIEITATNKDGQQATERRLVHLGATVFADAAKLNRVDYALIFATDRYDNWKELSNPIFDGKTIARSLEKYYGFKTEVVENASQEDIFNKLHEYASKKYSPLDQLLVFFAGHGYFDETFKEGYVVVRESGANDLGKTSYVRHSTLGTTINNNPCEHIMLIMDVCFSGTFGQESQHRGGNEEYGEPTQSELIMKKLQHKTRKYLTSGGKEYVPDGTPGNHSPFAKRFIDALDSRGGDDGLLTLNELMTHIEKVKTTPKFGSFGDDKSGSDFVFVIH